MISKQRLPSRSLPHSTRGCFVGVSFGDESNLYSFPNGHPLNNSRTVRFATSLISYVESGSANISVTTPVLGKQEQVTLFHEKEYVDFVKASSKRGEGFLDYGDTPSYKGVYEASLYTVGSSLDGLNLIMEGKVDHFFNPIGGLHHARRDRAGGFCVFNDSACAIEKALRDYKLKTVAYVDIDAHHGYSNTKDEQAREESEIRETPRVAYVDIDCHHGDGVYYAFEDDPRVIIADIHEDGQFLYPGTGASNEKGRGKAEGTKLNIPLAPGSGDKEFIEAFDQVARFIERWKPLDFIFFQCGADGLAGDPLTHLQYSAKSHAYAAKKLHSLAHELCNGRILAMGGGGYNAQNVNDAWMAVVEGLSSC
jgi:acetoin utilization protein AcuC